MRLSPAEVTNMRLAVPCALLLVAAACARPADPAPAAPARPAAEAASIPSPPAAPGLVRWHENLDAARGAAAASGKPVLVFQLLGRLDDELC
jgi:hypothetical protein